MRRHGRLHCDGHQQGEGGLHYPPPICLQVTGGGVWYGAAWEPRYFEWPWEGLRWPQNAPLKSSPSLNGRSSHNFCPTEGGKSLHRMFFHARLNDEIFFFKNILFPGFFFTWNLLILTILAIFPPFLAIFPPHNPTRTTWDLIGCQPECPEVSWHLAWTLPTIGKYL